MRVGRITDLFIKNVKPERAQCDYFDGSIGGFALRVSPSGTKSFVLMYRMGRVPRRLTIGQWPSLTLKEARVRADKARALVGAGIDPAAQKSLARATYESRLFKVVVDEFITKHAQRKNKSWRESKRILDREFVAYWRRQPIEQIMKRDVNEVLDNIILRGHPSAANHAFAAVRKFFAWCVERDYIKVSPCLGLTMPATVRTRDRVLSDRELVDIWNAAMGIGYPFGTIVQLLMLTGQRRQEVAQIARLHIDSSRSIWTIPASMNKSRRVHTVPLTAISLSIISSTPRLECEDFFHARGKPDRPLSGWSKMKLKLDKLANVTDWTLHDVRRTVATKMAELKIHPHVIEAVLNHRMVGVAGIYNRFDYLTEKREAIEVWTNYLMSITDSPPPPHSPLIAGVDS